MRRVDLTVNCLSKYHWAYVGYYLAAAGLVALIALQLLSMRPAGDVA